MNIYLISQNHNNDYDTYDSAVVVAATAEDARVMHPNGRNEDMLDQNKNDKSCDWVSDPLLVDTKFIGVAAKNLQRSVILASFNAG